MFKTLGWNGAAQHNLKRDKVSIQCCFSAALLLVGISYDTPIATLKYSKVLNINCNTIAAHTQKTLTRIIFSVIFVSSKNAGIQLRIGSTDVNESYINA